MSKEKLSALMDGELDPKELDALLRRMNEDESLLRDWQTWSLTSSVLRDEIASADFMANFSVRLAAEPVVLAPRRMRFARVLSHPVLSSLSVAASVAFVGIAVWQINQPPESMAVADNATIETALRDYLVAHHQSDGDPFAGREVIHAGFQPADNR